ncbi:MAG: CehA/McbA family metallohydrolase, partial [Myxococcales bacterium]|nr:CehA/McbA family metallohydrolase [Myxococcales bacterium]
MRNNLPLLLPTLALLSCGTPATMHAEARRIVSLDQAIGGPKAIAQPGDFLLSNGHARVAILANRNSLGPGLYGGSIVDADLVRSDPSFAGGRGLDQFAELFPTTNMNVLHPDPENPDAVHIVEDAAPGTAVIRVDGEAVPFLSLLGALWGLVAAPDFHMWTEYVAQDDVPWFTIRTIASTAVGSEQPPTILPVQYQDENFPLIDWAIVTGMVMGDFYLSGGSVDVFAPGIGFDEDGAVFESMQQGENSFLDPFEFPFLAGVADRVSYGLAPKEGSLWVPLFTASQTAAVGGAQDGDGSNGRFPPTEGYEYERYFFIGDGDIGSIMDQYLDAKGIPWGTVSGHVVEQSTGDALSGIDVFVYEPGAAKPWSQWETDVHPDDHDADGSFSGHLPVGDWELYVHDRSRPGGKRVPIHVSEGGEVRVSLEAARHGTLTFEVKDEMGRTVPSKVTLYRKDARPERDPVLGDGFVAGDPESVVFSLYGEGEVELAPGTYVGVASRGLEYELDWSEPFTVGDTQGAHVDFTVVRSVESTDWISADLHVHAVRSHDSGVVLADRVRTMVAEGVEFFSSTDHDFVVDYAPTVEALGLEQWVQTAVGNETTTVEIGHFLAFPLANDFLVEAGGGRDLIDWTDKRPYDLVNGLRDAGKQVGLDPFVFVGHPRDGILGYFDQYGFDPFDGTPGVPGERGFAVVHQPTLSLTNPLLDESNIYWDFDGLELLNGKRFDFLRTPTVTEQEAYAADPTQQVSLQWTTRTMEEQQGLIDGTYVLSRDLPGQIDDWFALLNLGFRYTALGNSDTHGTTSTEAGCPRNYVMVGADDPAFLDDQAVADAVRDHHVVASYGPFVRMTIDGEPIGGEVTGDGPHTLHLDVQAPTW